MPLPLLALGLLMAAGATGVSADSTSARCRLMHDNSSIPVESGVCRFSQRQGNVTILFRDRWFNFPYEDDGQHYERSHTETGIRFERSGRYTLDVLWR